MSMFPRLWRARDWWAGDRSAGDWHGLKHDLRDDSGNQFRAGIVGEKWKHLVSSDSSLMFRFTPPIPIHPMRRCLIFAKISLFY